MIDRQSPVPYYEQLFTILRDRIAAGDTSPDQRLPSESELTREYGLSRATVRQTLQKLETEGWAVRVPRRGVFASTPRNSSGWIIQGPQGFLESQLSHGATGIETSVVSASFTSPPDPVAAALGIGRGDQVFALERVRSMDGRLAMFSTNWFPGAAGKLIAQTAAVLDGTGSVDNTLRSSGFVTTGAHRVLHAIEAPEQVAQHLDVKTGSPILRVRSLSWDHTGAKFDYYETWVLTGVVPLEVNVASAG